jgi:hypothetical protein
MVRLKEEKRKRSKSEVVGERGGEATAKESVGSFRDPSWCLQTLSTHSQCAYKGLDGRGVKLHRPRPPPTLNTLPSPCAPPVTLLFLPLHPDRPLNECTNLPARSSRRQVPPIS